jgi:hypothetical protein
MNIFPESYLEWDEIDTYEFLKMYERDTSLEKLAEHFNRTQEEIIFMGVYARKELLERKRLMKEEGIEYDRQGRLKYNPNFHDQQGQVWTEKDNEYLCKYYEVDGREMLSMALSRTPSTVANQVRNLKRAGMYEYFKHLGRHW